ncbi:MAG: exodeoxyribonuclease VII small subunit [Gammaproteobacteria bacterium]|nr:exodeoxyribonuclease VII small subunit [Gammaproteobacteria bacterium]
MSNTESAEHQSETAKELSFEDAVQELEAIIQRMSGGTQSLETSIAEFERGIKIVRECQKMLSDAEQRVESLTKAADGQVQTKSFDSE